MHGWVYPPDAWWTCRVKFVNSNNFNVTSARINLTSFCDYTLVALLTLAWNMLAGLKYS